MFELQKSIVHEDVEYDIRTDYRDILNIIRAFEDKNLNEYDRLHILWSILFIDDAPEVCDESIALCMKFLDAGLTSEVSDTPALYSWDTDGSYILNAINKMLQKSIREMEYLHWFDFVGFFSEIGESTFSMIVGIRQKKQKGKQLEKHEQEFYRSNCTIIDALEHSGKLSLSDLEALADSLQSKG